MADDENRCDGVEKVVREMGRIALAMKFRCRIPEEIEENVDFQYIEGVGFCERCKALGISIISRAFRWRRGNATPASRTLSQTPHTQLLRSQ